MVPLDFPMSYVLGAAMAVMAGEKIKSDGYLNHRMLTPLLYFQVFLFCPVVTYLLIKYPGWEWMYLVDSSQIPRITIALIPAGMVLCTIAGFALSRLLILKQRQTVNLSLIGVIAGLPLIYTVIHYKRVMVVGSLLEFQNQQATPLLKSPMLIVLVVFGLLITTALGSLVYAYRKR